MWLARCIGSRTPRAAETTCVETRSRAGANRMSAKPPPRQASLPGFDRGAAASAPAKRGSLRWVRDVLNRSLRLQQGRNSPAAASADGGDDGGDPRAVTPDAPARRARRAPARPRPRDPGRAPSLHRPRRAADARLDGVEALPAKVVERALVEAEILAQRRAVVAAGDDHRQVARAQGRGYGARAGGSARARVSRRSRCRKSRTPTSTSTS